MRRLLVLLAAVLALLTLAACGDDGDEATGDSTTTAPAVDPLVGRTFEAVSLESETSDLVEGVPLRISFTDDEITVETGCNRLSGTYAVEGPILVIQGLGGTEMGCEPALMEQEAWISALLTTRPVITPTLPDGLVLSDEGLTLTLAVPDEDAAASAPLVGPEWTLDTLIDEESASSVPQGVTATITFADDGTYAVAAGCNSGSGTYEEGDGTVTIEGPALTRQRCDDATMDVEAAVVTTLDGEVTVSLESDRLTLTAAGGTGLSFTTPA